MFQTEINVRKHEEVENPLSVDEIEPRLFLGNVTAATNINFLKSKKITHILTIDSFPIPSFVISSTNVNIKFIQIADLSKENILQYFPESIEFIERALSDTKNSVLVHCFYGVSRSSTIVIAYLMKKYSLSYQKAYERTKSRRALVSPNHGFSHQIRLFALMNYKIDPNYINYKKFRLKLAAEVVKSAKILPPNFLNLIKPDPVKFQEFPDTHVYRCRKCRRVLAGKSNLLLHKTPSEKVKTNDSPMARRKLHENRLNNLAGESSDQDAIIDITDKMLSTSLSDKSISEDGGVSQRDVYCNKTYFLEPLEWMKDVSNSVEGKLYCPCCKTKLGSFNWIMASQCTCGKKIFPSFYLVPSKIDISNIVQNTRTITI